MRRTSGRASSTSFARPSTLARSARVEKFADQVVGQRQCIREPRLEGLGAFLAHQRVGIVALGQEQEAHLAALLHFGDRVLERAPGGGPSCAVAIEAEHHFADEPEDPLQVIRRRRGAERRDRVGDAGLVQAHDVHVALDHEQALQAARGLPRLVQAVELAPLVEQLRLGRVQVLRFAGVEHAPAEGDRPAARVADRKHHAVAEAVVEARRCARVRRPPGAR